MTIFGRHPSRILGAPFRTGNYRALFNMLRVYPDVFRILYRYVLNRGAYPIQVRLRTPAGDVTPTLYSRHDLLTVNEIFCRGDYACGKDLGNVVDIGSNIGISALYFLTRNNRSFCDLFEPNPQNIERLKLNLRGFEDRYTLHEVAVAERAGEMEFLAEPSGRYGGLRAGLETRWQGADPQAATVRVRCVHINEALGDVLRERRTVDVLKIDIEGLEAETLGAIAPDLLQRISSIFFEDANGKVRRLRGSRDEIARALSAAA